MGGPGHDGERGIGPDTGSWEAKAFPHPAAGWGKRWAGGCWIGYLCSTMSTQELREKAHKTVDAVPEEQLPRFVAILDEIKAMIADVDFDAKVKGLIETNRGLLERLAK